MENSERLSGALAENILTLLCFDDANCKVVRAAITPRIFGNAPQQEVAGVACDFIDTYGETVKDHLADSLEHILKGEDARKAATYEKLLRNLHQSRDSVNADYVVSQLHKYVRQQNLKNAVYLAVEALEGGNVDDAEVALQKGLNTQSVAFDPGLNLGSAEDVGAIFDNPEEEGFTLGIDELDIRGLYPRRKELTMLLAARGMGKSWFVTHCAKRAIMQGWNCVIVTLEMGQKAYAARMLQSLFSVGRRDGEAMVTRIERDRRGGVMDFIQEKMQRDALADEGTRPKLMRKAREFFKRKASLRIKAFPTGALTVPMLEAYLDGLERFEKFTPDLILVDYPDLMELDVKNLRLALGQVIQKIRGIGVKRNAAVVVVSQGNRESETATTVTTDMASEDISKLATADLVYTYSQTPAEYALGLGRLLVGKARNEGAKFSLLLTQAYAFGQFCLDSVLLKSDYWDLIGDHDDGREDRPPRGFGRGRRREEDEDDRDRDRDDPRGRRRPAAKKAARRRED